MSRRPVDRPGWAIALLIALALPLLALPSAPASAAEIVSPGPLTTVGTTPDLNCYVNHKADTVPEFYGTTACATLMAAEGVLYGPAEIPAGGYASPRTTWTAVSQEGPTGSGVSGDPYRMTTVVRGGPFRVTQVDTYIVGQESYRTNVSVENTGGKAADVIVYRAGDCFLQDSDIGYGRVDDGKSPTCVAANADLTVGERIEQFTPITPKSNYFQSYYYEVWRRIGQQLPFPDTCLCDTLIDNGAGVSWARTIPPSGNLTFSSFITFSPLGESPISVTKTATPDTVGVRGALSYTIRLTNSNSFEVTLNEVFDDLPPGFFYLFGSTSGLTGRDPDITAGPTGTRLSWPGPFVLREHDSISLTFFVRAAATAGTYANDASATAPDLLVIPAEDVLVTVKPEPKPDPIIIKTVSRAMALAGEPLNYTITLANPRDTELRLDRITEVLSRVAVYLKGSTEGLTQKNPIIRGNRLTWPVSAVVPPLSARQLHFTVDTTGLLGLLRPTLPPVPPPKPKPEPEPPPKPVIVRNPAVESGPLKDLPGPITDLLPRIRLAPLIVHKTAMRRSVRRGGTVKFLIRVTNPSKRRASDVQVCDRLPRELRVVTARAAKVGADSACWSIKRLAVGDSRTFSIVVRAARRASGRIRNLATAVAILRPKVRSAASVRVTRPPRPPEVTG